jgi:peptidoglycan/LPS O-acetylase OafA/YrhL
MTRSKRLLWADLGRGLAAYGVIAYHMDVPGSRQYIVLVDFFFVLSGFVLSRSVNRIQSAADWRHFMLKRLYRFMPLVWMALFVRVALAFGGTLVGKPCDTAECQFLPVISAALMLQFIVPVALTVMGPLWSLSIELIVNAAYAIPVRNRKTLILLGVLAGLVLLLVTYFLPQFNIPAFHDRGFARGVLSFGLGLAINFLPKINRSWIVTLPALGAAFLVLSIGLGNQALYASIVFAALIWGLSNIKLEWSNPVYGKLALMLGNASFGIYVWHGAFRGVVQFLAVRVGLEVGSVSFAVFNFISLAAISTVFALVTYHFVEMPIMKRFAQRSK